MKKYTGLMLVVAMLLMTMGMTAFADGGFFVSDSFDGYVTNAAPEATISGKGARVVETVAGGNKAFYAETNENEGVSLGYKFDNKAENYVIMADLTMEGDRPEGNLTLNLASPLVIMNMNEGGRLKVIGNKHIGGLGRGVKNNIAVAVDAKNNRYSVYLNRKKLVDGWSAGEKLNGMQGFSFNFEMGGKGAADIYIDNVYCYEGTEIYSESRLPKAKYNSETVEYLETVEQEQEVQRTIIKNADFEDGSSGGIAVVAKSNEISTGEFAGRKALKFHQTTRDDFYGDTSFALNGNYMVASIDVYIDKGTPNIVLFTSSGSNGQSTSVMYITGGALKDVGTNATLATVQKKKWTTIAAAFDYKKKTYDVYIDGALIKEKVKLQNPAIDLPVKMRLQMLMSTEENVVYFDNYKMYTGRTPFAEGEEEAQRAEGGAGSVFKDEKFCKDLLGGSVAFNIYGEYMFANGKRTKIGKTAYLNENGEAMVPFKIVCEAFGVAFSEETLEVNNKALSKKEVKDGVIYVSGKEISDALGKGYTQYERGIVVVGKNIDNVAVYPEVDARMNAATEVFTLDELSAYLLYDRPTAAELVDLYNSRHAGGERPTVYVTRDRLREIRSSYLKGGRIKEIIDKNYIPAAEGLIVNPNLPQHILEDGLRWGGSGYVMSNPVVLAIAYVATEDERYFKALKEQVLVPCSFPDWNAPRHHLDAATAAVGVAVAYSWFYDKWTESERKIIAGALANNALLDLQAVYNGSPRIGSGSVNPDWERMTGNWNSVCNGGTSLAIMALMPDYPEVCATLLSQTLHSLEYVTQSFFPDGGYKEGCDGYWSYLMKFHYLALASCDAMFGTDFGLSNGPGFADTWKFPVLMTNNKGIYNNYSDANGIILYSLAISETLSWFAKKFNKPEIGKLRFDLYDTGADHFGYSNADVLFYDEAFETASLDDLPLDSQFLSENVQAMSMRTNYKDKDAVFLSAHAVGELGADHGHLDAGTYVLDMSGFRVAVDLGSDDYNLPGMFDYPKSRNNYYRIRPEGHNLPVINPDGNYFGQTFGVYDTLEKLESKPRGAISVANLSNSYNVKAEKVRRGYMLTDERGSVTVRDEMVLKGDVKENIVYSMIHTQGEVEIVDKNTVIVKGENGKKVQIQFITNADSWEILDMDAKPLETSPKLQQNENAKVRRITFVMKTKSKNLYSAVRYSPLDSYLAEMPLENVKIDDWTIPDGEIIPMPTLDEICVDGKVIEGFSPYKGSYKVNIKNGEAAPEVTAKAGDKRIEITSGKYEASIKVYSNEKPDMYRSYLVLFKYYDYAETPIIAAADTASMTKHALKVLDVSEVPEPANGPDNTLDGSEATRWAANSDGAWIMYDLSAAKKISAVGISTALSNLRQTILDIEVSENGTDWIMVYSGKTPLGEGMAYFAVNDIPAKYIRITGYGNTSTNSSAWTSITEVNAYGR